jgi:hypothetical protein
MTIHIQADPATAQARITFSLPDDGGDRTVSVVGSFNDWSAGANPLAPQGDGMLSVTVDVSAAEEIHFRYLASDHQWFDDQDADHITDYGSVIALESLQATTPSPANSSTSSEGLDGSGASELPDDADDAVAPEPAPELVAQQLAPEPDVAAPPLAKSGRRRAVKQST